MGTISKIIDGSNLITVNSCPIDPCQTGVMGTMNIGTLRILNNTAQSIKLFLIDDIGGNFTTCRTIQNCSYLMTIIAGQSIDINGTPDVTKVLLIGSNSDTCLTLNGCCSFQNDNEWWFFPNSHFVNIPLLYSLPYGADVYKLFVSINSLTVCPPAVLIPPTTCSDPIFAGLSLGQLEFVNSTALPIKILQVDNCNNSTTCTVAAILTPGQTYTASTIGIDYYITDINGLCPTFIEAYGCNTNGTYYRCDNTNTFTTLPQTGVNCFSVLAGFKSVFNITAISCSVPICSTTNIYPDGTLRICNNTGSSIIFDSLPGDLIQGTMLDGECRWFTGLSGPISIINKLGFTFNIDYCEFVASVSSGCFSSQLFPDFFNIGAGETVGECITINSVT